MCEGAACAAGAMGAWRWRVGGRGTGFDFMLLGIDLCAGCALHVEASLLCIWKIYCLCIGLTWPLCLFQNIACSIILCV